MAHVQEPYSLLWKPQDVSLDKIDSQKLFIMNTDQQELNHVKIIKGIHSQVATIAELKTVSTQDTALFTSGMLITVVSSGTFRFDRNSVVVADDISVIAPTVGGGRWIANSSRDADTVGGLRPSDLGGMQIGTTPPTATTKGWIDTGNGGVLKYYNGTAWVPAKSVWG